LKKWLKVVSLFFRFFAIIEKGLKVVTLFEERIQCCISSPSTFYPFWHWIPYRSKVLAIFWVYDPLQKQGHYQPLILLVLDHLQKQGPSHSLVCDSCRSKIIIIFGWSPVEARSLPTSYPFGTWSPAEERSWPFFGLWFSTEAKSQLSLGMWSPTEARPLPTSYLSGVWFLAEARSWPLLGLWFPAEAKSQLSLGMWSPAEARSLPTSYLSSIWFPAEARS